MNCKKNDSVLFVLLWVTLFTTMGAGSVFAQFDEFSAQYDTLTTLAGTGLEGGKGVNRWDASFEGKPAIDAELSRPHFVMADPEGNLFIADKDAHGIRKILPDGNIYTVAGTNVSGDNGDGQGNQCQLASPNGLYVTRNGNCYILDLGNDKIRKLTPDGQLVTLFEDPNGISIGRGLWVSETEELIFYASNTRIRKWTPEEGIVTYTDGFRSLGNITVDPDGFLVATDRSGSRVFRIAEDGSKTAIAGNGSENGGGHGQAALETGLDGVRGVWFLDDGSYLLATHSGSQVWWVDTNGIIYLFLDGKQGDSNHRGDGEHFQTPGYKISEARSISVDWQGNILIAENDVGYIRRIQRKKESSMVRREQASTNDFNVSVFPNPFNAMSQIYYNLSAEAYVSLKIFSTNGQLVRALVDQVQHAGVHRISWDARNQTGRALPSGVYIYRLELGRMPISGRIVLLK